METWVGITFCAAAFQTVRFMLQKQLSTVALSAAGATFARFVFSAPLVLVLLPVYLWATSHAMPGLSGAFWAYAMIGGLAQILATVCVVLLFKRRNFAVGITFKKTEVVQTALVGLVVLGEGVSPGALIAILLGLGGVLLLSDMPEIDGNWRRRVMNPAAGLGLLSGILFAVSGVTYRGASLEIASDDPGLRALVTLAAVATAQMLALGAWLLWREPGQVGHVLAAHRGAKWIGLTSMAGSLCWFTAFTMQNAAYVNAVGQVELIFSLFASVLFFGERPTLKELGGIALLTISVLALILLV
ncbi:DMT family transporter [Lutimaribacter sp. EGI FJ00015]|uniref:DMT family transporter n=1 Tax=Lutimaribacter degradans TaxID=2945989 RepID=A0ACC5ZRT6_9RHOB|nr:EamA family transporter [Lutimaribacter sp. EGI FJ00013]MCM2560746.1 DMT family transporter [Lutimaribacter sp. EGI FJ00013]MCO0612308.1 DMT family transporter [Lutimaribacter sp. EGI FJ00015]MCO0634571.1 DMT family transporter [Lutimaribacter sp. EGI FJ00014]